MIKVSFLFVALVTSSLSLKAQDKFYTKSGRINFKCSKSPLEKIEAINKSGTCVLDTKSGRLQFLVMMKAFEFEKALMQEHFNENYVESHKFPKADFKGEIINNGEIDYTKDGEYKARVKGQLQIHGQTREVETMGKIIVKNGRIITNALFNILLSDYKINIPSLVSDKISNNINIIVDCSLEPLTD